MLQFVALSNSFCCCGVSAGTAKRLACFHVAMCSLTSSRVEYRQGTASSPEYLAWKMTSLSWLTNIRHQLSGSWICVLVVLDSAQTQASCSHLAHGLPSKLIRLLSRSRYPTTGFLKRAEFFMNFKVRVLGGKVRFWATLFSTHWWKCSFRCWSVLKGWWHW